MIKGFPKFGKLVNRLLQLIKLVSCIYFKRKKEHHD